ncbi:GAF domain-containing protein [Auraticoccus sp. F435]|uniref:GAF domain-containing protein n=2 Tax=Auraticoccus cholistanensis TaxID=2656650 RepID=A0A6A9UV38_9ACTN|nr:GAF domain-containing protein [Auraticoccus cholistanensis]
MGRLTLEETMRAVATFAVQAVPGAEGAALTLREDGRPDTVAATSDFVAGVDRVQHTFGQGPSLTAMAEQRVLTSDSLGSEEQWRQFGSRVARMGVHSALALPLVTAEGVVGALTVYARSKHAFDSRAAHLGRLFATPAAIAVQNAQVLAAATRTAEQLRRALEDQAVVERAVGILISRSGSSPAEALDRLRQLSQAEHLKLLATAERVVEEAARTARARRQPPPEPV